MSLTAWARRKSSIDLTAEIVLALTLFALAIPLLMSLNPSGAATPTPSSSSERDRTPTKPVQALRQAIIGQESGHQCGITNHSGSGAAGLAQIMPENVRAWSREAIGREVSVPEFLSDCRLQLQIIDHKLAQYWQSEQQSGAVESEVVRRVASRWYSGRAEWYDNDAPQSWNGNAYPSVRAYTLAVLARYQQQKGD